MHSSRELRSSSFEITGGHRDATPGRALLAALARPRYEILPLTGITEDVVRHVPTAIKITVTASPTRGLEPTLRTVETLVSRGYAAVPHLSARLVRDRAHLEEVVLRLRAAGVSEVFVIAGDARRQAGEFAGAAALLSAMGEFRASFREIGIAGYPESHQFISDDATIKAMFEKEPMATYIVSQICFDAKVIATWVRRVRDRGTLLPIWIGVPGPVNKGKLVRTSMRIGLGASARFLRSHRGWLRAFAVRGRYMPTELLRELAPSLADPAARIGGIHVYTFNELERTERWRREVVEQLTDSR
jgi:methylenetetrahydrofolate reductase (NADPH)